MRKAASKLILLVLAGFVGSGWCAPVKPPVAKAASTKAMGRRSRVRAEVPAATRGAAAAGRGRGRAMVKRVPLAPAQRQTTAVALSGRGKRPALGHVRVSPLAHRAEHPPKPAEAGMPAHPQNDDEPMRVTHDRKKHVSGDAAARDSGAPTAATQVRFSRRARLAMPPAMKGSHEILLRQNEIADRDGLDRVQDEDDLGRMRAARLLVAIPAERGLQLDVRLPMDRRYCRPWTAEFLEALARAHFARFGSALQVNSAVRTIEVQQRLLRTNGNAAPIDGDTASPHLTGQAIDITKKGLSLAEIAWMRGYLGPLVEAGKIDVEEEFQQSCFHISVYRRYLEPQAPGRETERPPAVAALASVVP